MIKLATIGTSAIVDNFLAGVKLTGEFILTAVYSRNLITGKEFALKHGCDKVFTNLEEMAKSDIDAVYIASPNVFHSQQSRLFLENGVHVICEKPIVTNAEDYKQLKALADSKSLIFMEAIIPRHTQQYSAVKAALSRIGKIALARIDFCQRSSRLDAFLRGENMNIFNMSLHAGTLMDLGVYCVYGAVDLLGMPNDISARSSLLKNGADGSGAAIFSYADFTAALTYSKTGKAEFGSEIIGEKGTLKISMISQYSGVVLVENGAETQIVAFPDKAHLMSGEAQRFADYILRYEENRKDYEKASTLCLNVHTCMDKIKQIAGLIYPTMQ